MGDRKLPWTAREAESTMTAEDAQLSAVVAAAIPPLINYAAVLRHQGKEDYLPDLRDLVDGMVWIWAPADGADSPDLPTRLQEDCQQEITSAVKGVNSAAQPVPLTGEQAEAIIHGLSVHAEEMAAQEDLLSVWQCCRLAKELRTGYAGQTESALTLQGNFVIDESDRFTGFGCRDRGHVTQGRLSGRPVLVFSDPVDVERIPEGWQCYHLAGRNIRDSDQLWKFIPQDGYTGTVLSPVKLISSKRPSARIDGQFELLPGLLRLETFCEQHGLDQRDLDGLFPETQALEESTSSMTMGGL